MGQQAENGSARIAEGRRDAWGRLALALQAARIGVRTLARMPGFVCLAVLVIAIGVGANVALFTVVRSVLLEPLPYKDPARLVRLYEFSSDGKYPYNIVAGGVFAAWQERSESFTDLAIVTDSSEQYNLASDGRLPERVSGAPCSWYLFATLGVAPARGRTFVEADDRPAATATVILSWKLWMRRFGGDPDILQRTIHLDAKPYAVIGVMPPWFSYPEPAVQLWTPVRHELPPELLRELQNHEFIAIGRLRPRATPRQALAELSGIVRGLRRAHPEQPFISNGANLRPLLDDVVGDMRGPLYLLLAATGCVLLIACLNVANLLMARAATRQRELAIRAALGSSRFRLAGQQLLESFLLSLAGGAGGLLLASAAIGWLVRTRQDMSRVEAVHIDGAVVAFTMGLMFFCAAFAGILSSAAGQSEGIFAALQESSRAYGGGPARAKRRKLLVALEVGLTVVLLVVAGLLLESYRHLRSADLGCQKRNVLTMRFNLPQARYATPSQRVRFYEALLERVRNLPGVQAAGLASAVPGQGYQGDEGFAITEHPPLPVGQGLYAIDRWVDPGYFAAIGIPMERGQTFARQDRLEQAGKVVVSASFVRQYLPGEEPLGKHLLTLGGKTYEIVGVAGDTRYNAAQAAQPVMYFPLFSGKATGVTLAARSPADVAGLALPIQRTVQDLDRELPVADILTMDELVARSALDASFEATLLLAFAVLSLVLAAAGLFGVLSYIVAQRTAELGIRMALGARRETLLGRVLLEGLQPAFAGVGLGLLLSLATVQFLRSMLYGISPLDPGVFAAVPAALLAVATAACLLPARRAARLDPVAALRAE